MERGEPGESSPTVVSESTESTSEEKRVSSVLIVLTGSYSSWVACLQVETFPTPQEESLGRWLVNG